MRRVSPLTVPMLMPNGPAAALSLEFGARAGVHATVSACASGAEAISLAADLIRLGRADVVVAGGTEAVVHPLPMAGFAQMRAMSTRNDEPERASRPFDKGRDGFVLGEGAGVLVLESAEHAAARGARVLRGDRRRRHHLRRLPHHRAGPERQRRGPGDDARAARRRRRPGRRGARERARHLDARPATSPRRSRSAPPSATDALVTAPKSMLGHLLGAAGAVETIATVLSVRDGVVPITRNLDDLGRRRPSSTSSRSRPAGCRCPSPSTTPSASAATTWPSSSARPDRQELAVASPVLRPGDGRTGLARPGGTADRAASTRTRCARSPRSTTAACYVAAGTRRRRPGRRVRAPTRRRWAARWGRRAAGTSWTRSTPPSASGCRWSGSGTPAAPGWPRASRRSTRSARSSPRWCGPPGGCRRSRSCSARPPAGPRTARR